MASANWRVTMAELKTLAVDPLEAIEFLREKLDVPTRAWTDVWEALHDRALMIAGAAVPAARGRGARASGPGELDDRHPL